MTVTPIVRVTSSSDLSEQIEPFTFSYSGPLSVYTGTGALYCEAPYELRSIRFYIATVADAAVTFDILCNGTSIFGTTKPSITAGQHTVRAQDLATKTTFAIGDVLTVNITGVGLSLPGADLTVTIRLKRLS